MTNMKKKVLSLLIRNDYDNKIYNAIYQLLLIEHGKIEKVSEEFVRYIITYNGRTEFQRNDNPRPRIEERHL